MPKTNVATEVISEPSICIPRTLNNITWRTVKDAFEAIIGKGTVERVDLIGDRNGEPFCKIFVHMRYWPNEGEGVNIRERLLGGETVKIVYDNPWFWKCSASRLPKPVRDAPNRKKPFVEYQNPTTEISPAAVAAAERAVTNSSPPLCVRTASGENEPHTDC